MCQALYRHRQGQTQWEHRRLEFPHMQSPQPVSWLVTQTPVSCVKEHRREGRRGCEWFSGRSPTPTFWKKRVLGMWVLLKRRVSTGHLIPSGSRTVCSWTPVSQLPWGAVRQGPRSQHAEEDREPRGSGGLPGPIEPRASRRASHPVRSSVECGDPGEASCSEPLLGRWKWPCSLRLNWWEWHP